MDPLHIAARTLLKTYGDDFCTEKQFVNYLSDDSRFEPVSLKAIMSAIVNEGYAKGLVNAKHNKENWQVYVNTSIPKIVNRNGFEDTYVSYCFQCLCYGLKLTDRVDEAVLSRDLSKDWTTTSTITSSNTYKGRKRNSTTTTYTPPPHYPFNGIGNVFNNVANNVNRAFASPFSTAPSSFPKSVLKRLALIFGIALLLILIIVGFIFRVCLL